ncbi:MAG: TolC family protein [Pirellulales bacterium]|nr:TolC family protein [Pirellulales bacterium]
MNQPRLKTSWSWTLGCWWGCWLMLCQGGCLAVWNSPSTEIPPTPRSNFSLLSNELPRRVGSVEKSVVASPQPKHASPPDNFATNPAPSRANRQLLQSWIEEEVENPSKVVQTSAQSTVSGTIVAESITPRTLTLEQLWQATLDQHPLLFARDHEINSARGRLLQAGLWPNPTLVLDTENELRSDAESTDITSRLMFTFPLGKKIPRAQSAAQAEIAQACQQRDADAQVLLLETTAAAYETRYYQELSDNLLKLREYADSAAKLQQKRVDARLGTISLIRLNAWSAHVESTEAASKYELAKLRLARAIGQQQLEPVTLADSLEFFSLIEMDHGTLAELARRSLPRIAAARAAWQTRQREVSVAWARGIPDLQVGPRFRGDTHDNGDSLGARVQLDLPIFNRNEGGIAAAVANTQAAAARLDLAELESVNDVLSAYAQARILAENLREYEELVVPAIQAAEADLETATEQQAIEAWQIIEARIRILKLKNDHLRLLYLYHLQVAQLELFLGRGLRVLANHPGE